MPHDRRLFPCYDVATMTEKLLRHPFQIVTFLIILSLLWALVAYGQTVEALQAMTRFTARISLLIFALVFSASALHKLFRSEMTAELLRNRRQFGLGFAYSHTVHFMAIVLFLKASGNQAPALSLIFGGLAYLFTYLLAFTSTDWSVRKLGAKIWKRLHKAGVFYIWFIFFITYLRRFLPAKPGEPGPGGSKTEFLVAFILVIAILILRLSAVLSVRAGSKTRVATENEAIS
jgi:methionine sulfoxide reductase heme-binding subunit